MCVCRMIVDVCGSEMTGGACCTVGAECQIVSGNEYCPTNVFACCGSKRGNPLIRLCYSLSQSCSHTHACTHTLLLSYLFISQAYVSLNPARTSPSVSVLGGLGCRLLCYWTEPSGKCPTIGCCQLVKFFCYHGCRVSCPNVSQCI